MSRECQRFGSRGQVATQGVSPLIVKTSEEEVDETGILMGKDRKSEIGS